MTKFPWVNLKMRCKHCTHFQRTHDTLGKCDAQPRPRFPLSGTIHKAKLHTHEDYGCPQFTKNEQN